jgi:hypothetical protein
MVQKLLFICGILSVLLYVAINVLVPRSWNDYNCTSQTVSELSAIGAPTRPIWVWLSTLYTLLLTAFACGVWKSAARNWPLSVAGVLMIGYGSVGILWPFVPMHIRETLAAGGATFTDTLHNALAMVTEIFYLLSLGYASRAFGKPFRLYSIVTFLGLLVFGILALLEAPGIAVNKPTPLIGIWERITIGIFLLWIAVLAITLLRKEAIKAV